MDIRSPSNGQAPQQILQDLDLEKHYLLEGVRVVLQLHSSTEKLICSPEANLRDIPLQNDNSQPSTVTGVIQDDRSIKFVVLLPLSNQGTASIGAYFDPTSDNLVLRSTSSVPFEVSQLPNEGPASVKQLNSVELTSIPPGTWRLSSAQTPPLDFKVFKRYYPSRGSISGHKAPGRPLTISQQNNSQTLEGPPTEEPTQIPNEVPVSSLPPSGNPFFDLRENEILNIPSVLETPAYQVRRGKDIASKIDSKVFVVRAGRPFEGFSYVVKVLKGAAAKSVEAGAGAKSVEAGACKEVVYQANAWLREFTIHEKLSHPCISKHIGGDARFLTLYQEIIPGIDLMNSQLRREDNLFLGLNAMTFQVWYDIATALEYLHKRGIKHNDIKPGNILLTKHGRAVLCDFGVSGDYSTGGTWCYIAPECVEDIKRETPGDIWAFGVTLLYLSRRIQLPESQWAFYFDFQHLYGNDGEQRVQETRTKAKAWLEEIFKTSLNLPNTGSAQILKSMLERQPGTRTTAAGLIKQLEALKQLEATGKGAGDTTAGGIR